ncbi:hypothetical protein [Spirosoma harenae]
MKQAILLIFLLPSFCHAQAKLTGLGEYRIGITTPDSISHTDFKEQEQAYAKGTVALPCNHIRIFKAVTKVVEGVSIPDLFLVFYDNKLYKIVCKYTDKLKQAFLLKNGKGRSRPQGRLSFCGQGNDKPMLITSEIWQNDDILALAIHGSGYNTDCQQEQVNRLTIGSQQMSMLASDCELQSVDLFSDEFDDVMSQSTSRSGNLKKKE